MLCGEIPAAITCAYVVALSTTALIVSKSFFIVDFLDLTLKLRNFEFFANTNEYLSKKGA
jgi:hypothetical protein